jgi:hypothetical protein
MLCRVLAEQYGDQVKVVGIDQWSVIDDGTVIAVAHCSNQDIFDQKLAELLGVVKVGDKLLLHCNYNNNFAAVSDHSLNLSEEQAKAFAARGATLFFAHEHQARTALGGSVVVFGNQWPTSIADCLNNDQKFAHILSPSGVTKVQTWKHGAEAGYEQVPWESLADYPTDGGAGFIRVFGNATANQAGECVSTIARFRAKSNAFVITNSVRVDGLLDNEALPENFEVVKAFDVLAFINSNLDEAQQAAVKKLLEVGR